MSAIYHIAGKRTNRDFKVRIETDEKDNILNRTGLIRSLFPNTSTGAGVCSICMSKGWTIKRVL